MTYNGPWGYIAVERVPQPVLAVPVAYYNPAGSHEKERGPAALGWPRQGGPKHKWKDD